MYADRVVVIMLLALCSGLRKRKKTQLMERMRTELKSVVNTDDVAAMQRVEDLVAQAALGADRVERWACEDMKSGLLGELRILDDELSLAEEGQPNKLPDVTATLTTVIMALDEKMCLVSAMSDRNVSRRIEVVRRHQATLLASAGTEANARLELAFSRLASWQEALVAMGAQMVDRDALYPGNTNFTSFTCPEPCLSCSFTDGWVGELLMGEEQDRFQCILGNSDGESRTTPASTNTRFLCDEPQRRLFVPWEFSTWCTVPGWILDAYQNARIAAMTTCGINSLVGTLKSGAVMSDELLRVCMLVEQRMVVYLAELTSYRDFMEQEGDGLISEDIQHAFGAFVALGSAEGLVGLRDSAGVVPPSQGETWEALLQGSNYTQLPTGIVESVPCNPPVNNWEVFLGGFAIIAGIGAAGMLGSIASLPLVLLSGFFFVLAGLVFLADIVFEMEDWDDAGEDAMVVAFLGLLVATQIPDLFVNIFTQASTTIYNFLVPERPLAACPRGLLFIAGSEPICLREMEKYEAERYFCPQDESRSLVVSCEPVFNGVPTIYGSEC